MMTAIGQVQRLKGNRALILYQRHSSCLGCQQQSQCATGQLQSALLSSKQAVWVELPLKSSIQMGDWIEVILPETDFLRLTLTLYGVPLLGLISGVLLSVSLQLSESMAVLLSLFGLTLGLIWVRYFSVKDKKITTSLRYVRCLGSPICGDFVTNPPLKDSE